MKPRQFDCNNFFLRTHIRELQKLLARGRKLENGRQNSLFPQYYHRVYCAARYVNAAGSFGGMASLAENGMHPQLLIYGLHRADGRNAPRKALTYRPKVVRLRVLAPQETTCLRNASSHPEETFRAGGRRE